MNVAIGIAVIALAAIVFFLLRGRGTGGGAGKPAGPPSRRWSWRGHGGAQHSVTVAMAMNDDYAVAAVSRAADSTRGDLPRALREVTLALTREKPAVTRVAFRTAAALDPAQPSAAPPSSREFFVTLTAVYAGPAVEPPVDGETLAAIFTTVGALRENELSQLSLIVGGPEPVGLLPLDGKRMSRIACPSCGVVYEAAKGACPYCGAEAAQPA